MEFLQDYGLFLAETVTLFVALILIISFIAGLTEKQKRVGGRLEIKKVNDKFQQYKNVLNATTLPKRIVKLLAKEQKRTAKETKHEQKKRMFILDFHGDLRASEVQSLREEVTAVLMAAEKDDEVLIRLESPGGLVHGYGLAASQVARIRDREIPLTIAVDKVAASGGYLMACVANRIIAAPFAILGSIGVLAQLPNFHRFLKKHDIDFELITAGQYKRTITMFGENTPRAREKFKEDMEMVHRLFKDFVGRYRPQVNIDDVATGEHWPALQAKELQLVDELQTSDDFLMACRDEFDLYEVRFECKKPLSSRLGGFVQNMLDKFFYNSDDLTNR